MDSLSTLIIEPDCSAVITSRGDTIITIGAALPSQVTQELDAIQLSIFSHRFMSIAEQMGRYKNYKHNLLSITFHKNEQINKFFHMEPR